MGRLRRLVTEPDTRAGRIFEFVIQGFIVLSLVTFSVETLPDLSDRAKDILFVIEAGTVIVFTAEYLLRLWAAAERRKFVFSFFGVIDVLAILPFYVSLMAGSISLDARSLRAFRMVRLFRVLKLARYSRAITRFQHAFKEAREELVLYLSLTLLMLYFSAVGIYHFEHDAQPEEFDSIFSSLWWAVATLTTVGYGDVYPITVGGRLFTFFVLMVGLGVVSVPAGLVAAALENARSQEKLDAIVTAVQQTGSGDGGSDSKAAENRPDDTVDHSNGPTSPDGTRPRDHRPPRPDDETWRGDITRDD